MQTASRLAGFLADTWIGRKRSGLSNAEAARAAVAHLKPIVAVTGGSRGIGAALAMRFAEAGIVTAGEQLKEKKSATKSTILVAILSQ